MSAVLVGLAIPVESPLATGVRAIDRGKHVKFSDAKSDLVGVWRGGSPQNIFNDFVWKMLTCSERCTFK